MHSNWLKGYNEILCCYLSQPLAGHQFFFCPDSIFQKTLFFFPISNLNFFISSCIFCLALALSAINVHHERGYAAHLSKISGFATPFIRVTLHTLHFTFIVLPAAENFFSMQDALSVSFLPVIRGSMPDVMEAALYVTDAKIIKLKSTPNRRSAIIC